MFILESAAGISSASPIKVASANTKDSSKPPSGGALRFENLLAD